jgi:hypothetical protein
MDAASAMLKCAVAATKKWKKQRLAEIKNARAESNRRYTFSYSDRVTIKEAAYDVMEQAYLHTSDNGRLPAKARQIMYAARPLVQQETGGECWSNSDYFTQKLLPPYIRDHREAQTWWVVWDARGHLIEPYTGLTVPLGGVEVENYLADIAGRERAHGQRETALATDFWPTVGPKNRYQGILFCEKEGFNDLFKEVRLAERYDLAIMSTKGMTVTAARKLVDSVCHEFDIPVFVLHDFDPSGLAILKSLQRSTDRYRFRNKIRVVDLGLRLADVEEHDLPTEDFAPRGRWPAGNLRRNGATDEEVRFLLPNNHAGQRVELNAFTSSALVEFVEAKLDEHGVAKLIPDGDILLEAYRSAWRIRQFNERTREISSALADEVGRLELPPELLVQIKDTLERQPAWSWDMAVAHLVKSGDRT